MVVAALSATAKSSLLPGVDLHFPDGTDKEVDLFGIHDGKFVAGEVKSKEQDFTPAQIAKDLSVSKRLGVDIHVMATMETFRKATIQVASAVAASAELEITFLDARQLRPEHPGRA